MERETLAEELSDQDRVLLVFGYLGPLALVPLVTSRREFVKWHAKQGLVLSVTVFVIYALLGVFAGTWFGWFSRAVSWMVLIGALTAALVAIVRGMEGERFRVPVIGDAADKL